MRTFLACAAIVLLVAVGANAGAPFVDGGLPFVANPEVYQEFTLTRPDPMPSFLGGPDPTCGDVGQKPCKPCGMDGEMPCGYAPARPGVIHDSTGDNAQNNPYKMFWAAQTPEQLSVCTYGAGVIPMTWIPDGNNAKQYYLVDGDIDLNPANYYRTWFDAQDYCVQLGATLANPKNAAENNFVWCLQPMLENRWLGLRLTWHQSPNIDIELQLERDKFPVDYQGQICAIINKERVCSLPPLYNLNGEMRSAEKRKSRRTMGSLLWGGNYSDDSDFLPPYDAAFEGGKFKDPEPPVYGNPLVRRPYIETKQYKSVTPWFDHEPNNRRGMENCVEMGRAWSRTPPSAMWNDFYCNSKKAFVCEKAVIP